MGRFDICVNHWYALEFPSGCVGSLEYVFTRFTVNCCTVCFAFMRYASMLSLLPR